MAKVRKAYVQGLLQRRVKYRIDLTEPVTIKQWLSERLCQLKTFLEEEWNAVMCLSETPPSLGLLLIEWHGGHILADVSICAPISHPNPPPLAIEVAVKRIDVCVEPIAPMSPPVEYVKLYTPGVKMLGRITLRQRYAVIKHRGLLFATEVIYTPDVRGGIELKLARYKCSSYDFGKALRKLKAILYSRY